MAFGWSLCLDQRQRFKCFRGVKEETAHLQTSLKGERERRYDDDDDDVDEEERKQQQQPVRNDNKRRFDNKRHQNNILVKTTLTIYE